MLPDYLEDLCEMWEPVGSRVTCNPPPTDTDQDILVLIDPSNRKTFLEELVANMWKECSGVKPKKKFQNFKDYPPQPTGYLMNDGSPEASVAWAAWEAACEDVDALNQEEGYGKLGNGAAFVSWRRGELNIILTEEQAWFDKFLEASECCKALNVMDKKERIAIFAKIIPKRIHTVKVKDAFPVTTSAVLADQAHYYMTINAAQGNMQAQSYNTQQVMNHWNTAGMGQPWLSGIGPIGETGNPWGSNTP